MKLSKRTLDENYMRMAFDKAFEHLGSTKNNPSVGCIVVKNNSVISSGKTSLNGRPHAEVNALSKNLNFRGSTLYVTLEPCIHYGVTPPCVNIIKKKGIKKVYYSILDPDKRTFNKAKNFLNKCGIKVNIGLLKKKSLDFYKSYFLSKKARSLPYTDVKIAVSKDFYSVDRKNKWITNIYSRNKGHFIRSKYDCILSTYKSINTDDSLLNCRINGLENLSPSRAIIDKDLKLNTNLKLFKNSKNIPTFVITCKSNKKKEDYFRSKKIRLIKINKVNNSLSYEKILMELKKNGFTRVLCESGMHTTRSLLKSKFVSNIYVFMSQKNLKKNGKNSFKKELSNLNLNIKKRIKVNLYGDNLYKFKVK